MVNVDGCLCLLFLLLWRLVVWLLKRRFSFWKWWFPRCVCVYERAALSQIENWVILLVILMPLMYAPFTLNLPTSQQKHNECMGIFTPVYIENPINTRDTSVIEWPRLARLAGVLLDPFVSIIYFSTDGKTFLFVYLYILFSSTLISIPFFPPAECLMPCHCLCGWLFVICSKTF